MKKVFIYWDNSNIFIGACHAAEEQKGREARYSVRVHFHNLFTLARAGREIGRATAVGSVPPEMRQLWNRMENEGVRVQLFERGDASGREQGVDHALQTSMLRDALDNNGDPGIVVLLTGDGAGFTDGVGFRADIERMYKKGWGIEVLSWRHSCHRGMREWAEENGVFIALDDFYEEITFTEPSAPGHPLAPARYEKALDLTKRKTLR